MDSSHCFAISTRLSFRSPPTDVVLLTFALVALFVAGCATTSAEGQTDDTAPVAEEPEEATADTEPQKSESADEPSTSSTPDEVYDTTLDVAVAATDIEAGAPLRKSDVTSREVPAQFLPANPLLKDDVAIYLGLPLSEDIREGDMILIGKFVAETGITLADRIPDGERALTIPSTSVDAETVLIEPGDRVDILGTFSVDSDDIGDDSSVTLSLLQNVTVLATGSCLSEIDDACDPDGDIIVSVTPEEAEYLTVSRNHSDLTILVRNPADMETVPVTRRSLREVLEQLDIIQQQRDDRTDEPMPEGDDDDDVSIIR